MKRFVPMPTIASLAVLNSSLSLWTAIWQSVALLLTFFVGQLVGIAVLTSWVLPATATLPWDEKILLGSANGTVNALTMLVTFAFILGMVALLVRLQGNPLRDVLALRAFKFKHFLLTVGLLLLLNVIISAISAWLEREPMAFMQVLASTAHPFWLLGLAIIVVVPIYEEMMFRGFMWTALASSRLGVWGASIITSVVFAMIHAQYGLVEWVGIFTLAMLFSYARAISGSLWLPVALHMINNGLAMLEFLTT